MKFGCCLNMVAEHEDRTGIEHLPELSRRGYDYVELPLAEMMELSGEEFERLVADRLREYHMACETCNNFFPGTVRLTGEGVDLEAVMCYVREALARASSLGVQYVVFGSGKAKNVPEGYSMEEGRRQVVELLRRIGPVAEENGITIVIEPLRRQECNLINTFEEGCRLAEDTGHEHVKVLVDFYHLTEEKEPVEHLLKWGREYLRHVHFANPAGRVYPAEMGEADYGPFFDALREIGYDERISCEAYAGDFPAQAEKALRFLKEFW